MEIVQQTAGAGVGCGSGSDRSERDLRDREKPRERSSNSIARRKCPAGQIEEFRQPIVRVNLVQAVDAIGYRDEIVPGSTRHARANGILVATRAILTYDLPWPK